LLINKPFQLRFAFFVVSWMIALSVTYPMIIYELFEMMGRLLAKLAIDPTFGQQILSKKTDVIGLLVLLQLAVMSVMFLVSIFLSHRIAGPIYKLSRSMELARDGKLEGPIFFRKNDHFQEVAQIFNSLHAKWKERLEIRDSGIQAAIKALESALPQTQGPSRIAIEDAILGLKKTTQDGTTMAPSNPA
jgi:methyl-accepting chemotaxis protein